MGWGERIRGGAIAARAERHEPADKPGTIIPGAKKLALVGTAPSWRFAPFNDPSWRIWALTPSGDDFVRAEVWFELHDDEDIERVGRWERLASRTCPVVMQYKHARVPKSIAYPLEVIAMKYTLPGRIKPAITSSMAYMLALALEVTPRPETIAIYGCDVSMDSEYDFEREALAFFVGVAHGQGIDVTLQSTSDLLYSPFLYAFEQRSITIEAVRLRERMAHLRAEIGQRSKAGTPDMVGLAKLEGARQQVEYQLKRLGG